MLQASSMEGSRTALDESMMPPPSRQRGIKRKSLETLEKDAVLPVSQSQNHAVYVGKCLKLESNRALLCFQPMGVLEQTLQPLDQSVLSHQLEMPQVDLPPEDTTNLSRLIPELDLLDEKSKDKDKDDSDEEVRSWLFTYIYI